MQFGIVDYLLRVRGEPSFRLAKELGFDCLELSADRIAGHDDMIAASDWPRNVRMWSESTGVSACSVYATQFLKESLVHPHEPARRPAFMALRTLAEQTAQARIGTLVVPLFGASEVLGDPDTEAVRQLLDSAADWGAQFGVQIALKTIAPTEPLLEMLDRTDSEWLGVCFDPGNSVALGQQLGAAIDQFARRLTHVHLKDRAPWGASLPLGEGSVNLPALFSALQGAAYGGPVVLETPAGRSAVDSARSNLSYCRRAAAA